MQHLIDAFRYSAWANARILAAMAGLDTEDAERPIDGIYGSVGETLRHLLMVEDGYLELMSVRPRVLTAEASLTDCANLASSIGQDYAGFVPTLSGSDLGRTFHIPWFKRDVTLADGLLQVLTHSTEHRADLASALTRLGVTTPPIDYVLFVFERDGHPVNLP